MEADLTGDSRNCLGTSGSVESLLKLIKPLDLVKLNMKARTCRDTLERGEQGRDILYVLSDLITLRLLYVQSKSFQFQENLIP